MTIEAIAQEFGITVTSAKKVALAVLSNVYIINGTHVLRSRTLEPCMKERFVHEYTLLNLARTKIPVQFPALCTTTSGADHVIDGAVLWTMYPLIPGDVLCSWWELFKLTPEQEQNIFVTLGTLHRNTAGALTSISREGQYDLIADIRTRFADPDPKMSEMEHARISTALERATARNAALTEQELCFVHGDFHPGNIVFSGNTVTGLLDTDWSRKGYGIEDLAYTLMTFMRDYRADAFTFDQQQFERYLAWYGLPQEAYADFVEYFILYTLFDLHLFDRTNTIPHPEKTREFQRAFLRAVCERF
jgi:aminoglycoside phosphotransferase (APT) family kinase protein